MSPKLAPKTVTELLTRIFPNRTAINVIQFCLKFYSISYDTMILITYCTKIKTTFCEGEVDIGDT
jgi:hypothetical protein